MTYNHEDCAVFFIDSHNFNRMGFLQTLYPFFDIWWCLDFPTKLLHMQTNIIKTENQLHHFMHKNYGNVKERYMPPSGLVN